MAIDAVDINISVESDGSGVIRLTVHDDRLEERVQLLRARGASKQGDTWHLEVDDVGEIGDISGHILGLMADLLNPDPQAAASRQTAIKRDNNRCRICGRDFDGATSDRYSAGRVVDHMYPKHEAGPQHGVHKPYNLVTVCRGCDDVFLQGDAFRFIPAHIESVLGPFDRQLLAWLQKRGLGRSDWFKDKLANTRSDEITHERVLDRLRTFAGYGVVTQLPDIAEDHVFDVFRVNSNHRAVAFLDKRSVNRHNRLPVDEGSALTDTDVIEMAERRAPDTSVEGSILSGADQSQEETS